MKAIQYGDENLKMPPKAKLPDAVIADLKKWIAMGTAGSAHRPTNAAMTPEQAKNWWAFQPIGRPLQKTTFIDDAVLAKLRNQKLAMSPPADLPTLVRRYYLDLWGMPPTPSEVAEFLRAAESDRNKAVAQLIDKLMANSHFGERWGRHWLDVARFGEDSGYEHDNDRPHAWHYRDFVIQAMQQDLPFDKFVQWQIAGDELAPNEPMAWHATRVSRSRPNEWTSDPARSN